MELRRSFRSILIAKASAFVLLGLLPGNLLIHLASSQDGHFAFFRPSAKMGMEYRLQIQLGAMIRITPSSLALGAFLARDILRFHFLQFLTTTRIGADQSDHTPWEFCALALIK